MLKMIIRLFKILLQTDDDDMERNYSKYSTKYCSYKI